MNIQIDLSTLQGQVEHYRQVKSRLHGNNSYAAMQRRVLLERQQREHEARRRQEMYKTVYTYPIGPRKPKQLTSTAFWIREAVITLVEHVADCYNVQTEALKGDSRNQNLVLARQRLFWELYNLTAWSLSKIGAFMHRDHTTVLHGIRQHQKKLDAGELEPSFQYLRLKEQSRLKQFDDVPLWF